MNILRYLLAAVAVIILLAASAAVIYGPVVAFFVWGWKAAIGAFAISLAVTGTLTTLAKVVES
jgi:hypothetical protein